MQIGYSLITAELIRTLLFCFYLHSYVSVCRLFKILIRFVFVGITPWKNPWRHLFISCKNGFIRFAKELPIYDRPTWLIIGLSGYILHKHIRSRTSYMCRRSRRFSFLHFLCVRMGQSLRGGPHISRQVWFL